MKWLRSDSNALKSVRCFTSTKPIRILAQMSLWTDAFVSMDDKELNHLVKCERRSTQIFYSYSSGVVMWAKVQRQQRERENQNHLSSTSSALCWISRRGGGAHRTTKNCLTTVTIQQRSIWIQLRAHREKGNKRVYLCLCTHSFSLNCSEMWRSGFNSHDNCVRKSLYFVCKS